MERVNGIAPLSRPWHGRILLLNHTRKKLVSPAGLTSQVLRVRWRNETVRYRELQSHQQPDASDAPALCFELLEQKVGARVR